VTDYVNCLVIIIVIIAKDDNNIAAVQFKLNFEIFTTVVCTAH